MATVNLAIRKLPVLDCDSHSVQLNSTTAQHSCFLILRRDEWGVLSAGTHSPHGVKFGPDIGRVGWPVFACMWVCLLGRIDLRNEVTWGRGGSSFCLFADLGTDNLNE